MNKLEGIVRPFASGDVFSARALPPTQPAVVVKPRITVIIGKPIDLMMKPIGITNLFGGQKLSEVSRRTTTKRVFNPSDSNQFVDVARMDFLHMKNSATGEDHEFTFNNPP